jgi:hypothetical protein
MLASVFAWAAVSKVVGRHRWRRSLAAYGLSPALERLVAWAVPVTEALVPVLVMAGLRRLAGLLSAVLLLMFSVALVRARQRTGGRVPCGCLGGRDVIDVRTALARNVGMTVTAAFVFARAADAPVIFSLNPPRAVDVLPLTLTLGAFVASALLAWRASVWLARGRRA